MEDEVLEQLTLEQYTDCFNKLALRFSVSHELAIAYYDFLKAIPEHRFATVCDRIFCDCDFLPSPQRFLDLSYEIARAEMERCDRLESSEDRHDRVILEEVDSLSQEQRVENIRRLREMLRGASASMPAPDYPQSEDLRVDKLNRWLQDPLLRNEAIAQIQASEDLVIKFDDDGAILGVWRA